MLLVHRRSLRPLSVSIANLDVSLKKKNGKMGAMGTRRRPCHCLRNWLCPDLKSFHSRRPLGMMQWRKREKEAQVATLNATTERASSKQTKMSGRGFRVFVGKAIPCSHEGKEKTGPDIFFRFGCIQRSDGEHQGSSSDRESGREGVNWTGLYLAPMCTPPPCPLSTKSGGQVGSELGTGRDFFSFFFLNSIESAKE